MRSSPSSTATRGTQRWSRCSTSASPSSTSEPSRPRAPPPASSSAHCSTCRPNNCGGRGRPARRPPCARPRYINDPSCCRSIGSLTHGAAIFRLCYRSLTGSAEHIESRRSNSRLAMESKMRFLPAIGSSLRVRYDLDGICRAPPPGVAKTPAASCSRSSTARCCARCPDLSRARRLDRFKPRDGLLEPITQRDA